MTEALPAVSLSGNSARLLAPDEPPVFTIENAHGASPVILLADHAGRAIPRQLDGLGVGPDVMDQHVAYDIGIDRMTRRLARHLDAPALLHGYSRLVIDPNRPTDDPTSICVISDRTIVPGNRNLTAADRARRIDALFTPYHREITRLIDTKVNEGLAPVIVSMHSFTPASLSGRPRPWHLGILWADDGRVPVPLMDLLAEIPDVIVGDNEPYSAKSQHGYTIEEHALPRKLANVLIEVRQDLISDDGGADAWADLLAEPLARVLDDPALYRVTHGPAGFGLHDSHHDGSP